MNDNQYNSIKYNLDHLVKIFTLNSSTCDNCKGYSLRFYTYYKEFALRNASSYSKEINYDEANRIITELTLFIKDAEINNDTSFSAHETNIKLIFS